MIVFHTATQRYQTMTTTHTSLDHQGQCSCGTASFTVSLPVDLPQLSPRACDCHFCASRKIAWLSHPKGKLAITSHKTLLRSQQGSEQADFLTCPTCHDVIAASITFQNQMLAAVNATLLLEKQRLAATAVVSPKTLSPDEKIQRWQQVWMPSTVT